MSTDQLIKLIEVIIALIQALSWPLLVLVILMYFGNPLKKFLENASEFTFKGPGWEATVKKQQIEAAKAKVVDQAGPQGLRKLGEASILWVDDNPSNNFYERSALEKFGVRFAISTSTEDALEKIRVNKYDAIISDMGRRTDARAGYTLLAEKQKLGDTTPFIIYAGSNAPQHKAEARQKGAIGSTNNPQELFELVTSALQVA